MYLPEMRRPILSGEFLFMKKNKKVWEFGFWMRLIKQPKRYQIYLQAMLAITNQQGKEA